jgi:hypothetical protein
MPATFTWSLEAAALGAAYEAFESALVSWVQQATGLEPGSVYLANQNGPSKFPGPCAVISVGDLQPLGALDELRWDFDAGRPAGTEIVYETRGWRECTISVACFAPTTVGDATARAVANAAQMALRLPPVRSALNAAGIGVLDAGPVRWVPVVDSGKWYGQAVLEVRVILRQTAAAAVGYISTYEASVTVTE